MRIQLASLLLTTAAGLATAAPSATAATYSAHDGASLVAAVQSANGQSGPSTIDLTAGAYAPTTTITVRGDLSIVGPSTPVAKIVGSAISPTGADLFDIAAGARVTLVGVAMTNAGYASTGAAVDDFGTVDLESSTLAGNDGPGLIVEPDASATLRNDTLSDGLAAGLVDDGSATLVNDTVADNAVEGIDDRVGTLTLINTIVADNDSGDCSAPAHSSDHSLDSDGSCGVGALGGTDPQLGPLLASNGGPTPTQALGPSSPAIGAGDEAACPSVDQRDFARGGRCDIGAYQAGAEPAPGLGSNDAGSGSGGGGSGSSGSGTGSSGPDSSGSRPSRRVVDGVSGHGAVRGSRHARITFALQARTSSPHGSLSYHDAAGRVWLRDARVASVAVDAARGTVTFHGTSINVARRQRVRFVATVVDHGRDRTVRVRLSSGYAGGGPVLDGRLTLTTAVAPAAGA